ncbi:MAG: hypothetical protein J4431_00710 [Candidatus Aenigmarchaeota archaeon]|nr:hypothetical protein [Candidatus Aenigmarchaeota archaeon]
MKKGITPVIAIILLLLITIAVIGFATGFFQSIVTTGGQQAQDASKATGDRVHHQERRNEEYFRYRIIVPSCRQSHSMLPCPD